MMSTIECSRPWATRLAGVILGVLGLAASPSSGQGDHLARVNSTYEQVPESRRSDGILLRALIAMDEPPIGIDSPEMAALTYAGSLAWGLAEDWALAPAQRAALTALRQVTENPDERRGMIFAQVYGSRVSPEFIRARAYTELGDPPLLAGARMHYLEQFDNLWILSHIEATRLNTEGKTAEACDVLVRLIYVGRQLSDRVFAKEMRYGLSMMMDAATRIRDISYEDFRGSRSLSPQQIQGIIARLELYNRGYLNPERLVFPTGNKVAAEQLLETLYVPRGGVREDLFASVMARLRTSDRPLRLFAEASRFESAGANQADWFEVRDAIDRVFDGWSSRWRLSAFDRQSALPHYWDQFDRSRFAVVTASTTDLSELFRMRRVFEAEVVGTRHALAVLGYFYELGVFPPDASSVRPRWLTQIEADPFNPNRAAGRLPSLEYFVPVRDAYLPDERAVAQPHRMNVFAPGGENFAMMLREDQFVMYSVGQDGVKNFAEDVSNDVDAITGDYLIWPPMLSIHREHLRDTGRLP